MTMMQKDITANNKIRKTGRVHVSLKINGEIFMVEIEPRRTLAEVLRNDLQFTGTKIGCNMGQCGACTVLIDGKAAYSCLTLAIECENREISTIEGLSRGGNLDPVQQAFIEHDAFQCGYCTPGQIMAVKALVSRNPDPSNDEIRNAVSGNICRCGAYPKIIKAAKSAAKKIKHEEQ